MREELRTGVEQDEVQSCSVARRTVSTPGSDVVYVATRDATPRSSSLSRCAASAALSAPRSPSSRTSLARMSSRAERRASGSAIAEQTIDRPGSAWDGQDCSPSRHGRRLVRAEGRVLAEDRLLELAQGRARLDAELVDEQAARVAIDPEGFGLTAGAVERLHQRRPRSGCSRTSIRTSPTSSENRPSARSASSRCSSAARRSRRHHAQRPHQIAVRRLPRREIAKPREIGDAMTRIKVTAVLCIASATVTTAALVGAAASHSDARSRAGTITRFAGFPPIGVRATMPTTGRLVLGLTTASAEWDVYADELVIGQKWTPSGDAAVLPKGARRFETGYVQQRLTLRGCDHCGRRSLRPACSSTICGSRSGSVTPGSFTGFAEAIEW